MILCISTSLSRFCLCLGTQDSSVLYCDEQQKQADQVPDLTEMIKTGLAQLDSQVTDIKEIFVDIGPGGTSSVRTGVAIANGMAYGLKIPVAGISSIEMVGLRLAQMHQLPVLVLHKAIKNNYYVGLYHEHKLLIHYGPLATVVEKMILPGSKAVLTGSEKGVEKLIPLLPEQELIVSQEKYVDPATVCTHYDRFADRLRRYPELAVPITEDQLAQFV